MGKGEKKVNIPLCAALILLTLTLITTHMTCGLYARYTSSATGSASARVAKFKVECVVAENTETTDVTNDFIVTVTNNSEVAVNYSLIVKSLVPLSVTLGEETKQPKDGELDAYFKNDAWVLAPNGANARHVISLNLESWDGLTDGLSGIMDSKQFGFTVSVRAVQID